MTLIERFLKYVSFDTQSDDNSGVTPSTPKQMVFAQYLRSELEQLGLCPYISSKTATILSRNGDSFLYSHAGYAPCTS